MTTGRLALAVSLSLTLFWADAMAASGQAPAQDLSAALRHGGPASFLTTSSVGARTVPVVDRSPLWAWEPTGGVGAAGGPERRIQASPAPSVAKPMLLSAVVPGVGQLTMGQRRGWLYLALEAVAWGLYLDRRAAGADGRDAYRDFAWQEARLHDYPRVEGEFDYYETMSKWNRSGAFDVDPEASGVQPESDATTYNGSIWTRATGIFVPGDDPQEVDPGYQRALAYYSDRAHGPEFLWDWRGEDAVRETYTDMIRISDDRFRQATNVLGAIIANHLISAVDAFFSARGVAPPVQARFAPTSGVGGAGWTAFVSLSGAP